MRKSTKIIFALFVLVLIPAIILGKDVFNNFLPMEDGGFVFNPSPKAISSLVLMGLALVLGVFLYGRFLSSLPFDKVIFFSSLPIILVYGYLLFLLAYLSNLDNPYANAIKDILNITTGSGYNTILWAVLLSIVFIIILFFNFILICKPMNKIEHIVSRLGDGKVKEENLKLGGGRQFKSIEHSLNKINNNYKIKDNSLKSLNYSDKNSLPRQIYKFIGRDGVQILEREKQVKKSGVVAIIKLTDNSSNSTRLEDQFEIINAYMNSITPIVKKCGGFIDKFIGDAIVAVFTKADSALDCSRNILRTVYGRNRRQSNIFVQIALHYGEIVLAVKSEEEKVPTIISSLSVVNKISEIAKFMKGKIVFSKAILDNLALHYHIDYRYLGSFNDSDEEILVFEDLSAYPKDYATKLIKNKNIFEKGVILYNNREFDKAGYYFEDVLRSIPDDNASYIYFNKTKEKLEAKS